MTQYTRKELVAVGHSTRGVCEMNPPQNNPKHLKNSAMWLCIYKTSVKRDA